MENLPLGSDANPYEDDTQLSEEQKTDLIEGLYNRVKQLFPDLSPSHNDVTEDEEAKIDQLCRDGTGLPYQKAFEIVTGRPYVLNPSQPERLFDNKSDLYLKYSSAILVPQAPPANHKRELRILRDKLTSFMPGVELRHLKGEFASDQEAGQLQDFIIRRLKEIKDNLKK